MRNTRREKPQRSKAVRRTPERETQDLPPAPRAKRAEPLKPKTETQARYISSIRTRKLTFGLGPAGSGKTYCSTRIAAEMLSNREISKIVLSRPAVEVGNSIGYLPGEMSEKMAPYMASFRRGFEDGLGAGGFDYHIRAGNIEIVPLNFMQGLSWDADMMILLDEAENATPVEMKMFLTRFGEGAVGVVNGDASQKMIAGKSGLIDGVDMIGHLAEVGVVRFAAEDCVRSGFVRKVIEAYEQDGEDDQMNLPGFVTNGVDRR